MGRTDRHAGRRRDGRGGASIWYGAVLRADFGPIVVGEGANIQDNSVVHTDGTVTSVGPGATIGHLCVVHACTIGAEAVIGNASTVQDGAVIGEHSMVAAGALVLGGTEVPPEALALGVPAKVRGPLTGSARQWVESNPGVYQELARRHGRGVREL
ncbi:gamma carbonic anhydrase family protein [Allosalinactinospora lopnorensis]|uniref:gamma carbonic anhydrase family protein n=1 Tax=Allosalinactinospora lopnorensis TaxID=1352348 RepID=UPI00191C639C|nr:gamma carbonic anhydrase family protein [Allosalinactinospora lopnorensis]